MNELKLTREFDNHFFLTKICMIYIGLWPLDGACNDLKKSLKVFAGYFFVVSLILVELYDIYFYSSGSIEATAEIVITMTYAFGGLMKISHFLKEFGVFKDMWHTMHVDWTGVLANDQERSYRSHVMRRLTIKTRKYCRQYALLTLGAAVMYMTMPFIGNQAHRVRKYPFFGRYYYDDQSDLVYILCYISQVITGTFCATTNYALDTLFLICSYHMCAQLKILKHDLMNMSKKNVAQRLTCLIRRHQREIRNVKKLQKVFSNVGFWQLFVACVITCINIFKMLNSIRNKDPYMVLYLLCLPLFSFQILFYCQPGNKLMLQSQALGDAIYKSGWLDFQCNYKRDLKFMIHRCQLPLTITAGKIYTLSIANFMEISRISLSALSVLRAIDRKYYS
ncbi:hypothetical protein TKK_0019327 [Trichogramma kaykai]